jgi:hypothetical protein
MDLSALGQSVQALDLKCELSHSDRTPEDDLFVLPLSSLSCRVQTSDMGDWVPVRWEVVEAPAGSSASFVPEGEREASFFVDLAGRFVLRATAEESGCSYSDTVTLVSRPDEDIHIQVVWNTPGDPDQTDTGFGAGTDFDLHFLHENGCWEDSTYDCHFRARQPNWGNPARSDDDPSLDIDDTDGAGPENINLDNPEHDRQYRLGVHSYNDHGYGPSLVTMRVFVFGELVYEYADKELGDDEWWVVGAIDWPSGEVVAIDEIYQDVPSCGN